MKRAGGLLLTLIACTHNEPKPDPKPEGDGAAEHKPLLAGLLLPPAEAGAFNTKVEGCAATPEKEPEATRSALPNESVVASAVATGVVLTHEVPHACCLKAKTTVEVKGDQVVVTDTLEGTACRCRCSSTLKTAVGLAKGSYTVEVKTVEPNAAARSAWSGPITVQ